MKKILIVEDGELAAKNMELFLRQVCQELGLQNENFSIERVKNEQEAINKIQNNNYCVIILDGNIEPLPHGHGKNVLKAIDQKNLPKIIVASMEESFVKECLEKNIHAGPKEDLPKAEGLIKELINAS